MKVLMSAYACEPNRGSEPGVGWNWALQAARHHEVWVLTRSDYRTVIETELARNPQPGLHFIYHELPFLIRLKERSERVYSFLWELSVLVTAFRVARRIGFDVTHHVTLNSIELPGLLWLLSPPFVWGPVGGAQEPPTAFTSYLGGTLGGERLRVYRKRMLKFNPIVRLAVRKSRILMAANRETQRMLEGLGGESVQLELETAIHPSPSVPIEFNRTGSLNLIWVGLLIPRKAPMLAVEALEIALSKGADWTLTFVGDGPLRGEIEKRIETSVELGSHIRLAGRVNYEDMRQLYAQADAFLFTSLNDTSGNVVLEAMSAGLPVITLNHQGVAEIVTEETGIKVPALEPEQVVSDLADAMRTLANDGKLRVQMGAAGRKRVESNFSWTRKGDTIVAIYQKAGKVDMGSAISD